MKHQGETPAREAFVGSTDPVHRHASSADKVKSPFAKSSIDDRRTFARRTGYEAFFSGCRSRSPVRRLPAELSRTLSPVRFQGEDFRIAAISRSFPQSWEECGWFSLQHRLYGGESGIRKQGTTYIQQHAGPAMTQKATESYGKHTNGAQIERGFKHKIESVRIDSEYPTVIRWRSAESDCGPIY